MFPKGSPPVFLPQIYADYFSGFISFSGFRISCGRHSDGFNAHFLFTIKTASPDMASVSNAMYIAVRRHLSDCKFPTNCME